MTTVANPVRLPNLSRRARRRTRAAVLTVLVVGIVAWSIGPFLWQLNASFQPDVNLTKKVPSWLPIPFTVEHYRNVFGPRNFAAYLQNSLLVTTISTVLTLAIGTLGAYAMARLRVAGKGLVLGLLLAMSMFPHIAVVTPLYRFFGETALLNTYLALIAPYIGLSVPLVVFILHTHLRSIPREIDEAAAVDGAGKLRTLWSVILPLAAPGMATAAIIAFIGNWNELMLALAFTSTQDRQTVSVGIVNFTDLDYVPLGDMAAASIVVTVPLVVLVLIFQRRIVTGLTSGGVKA
ncbi:ABC-type glycerol-3-phosphate transport system permease component [Kribbella aluminosa]|uniref:ABC-type glycerol-3-phosphate transport system permease component n=1 Tax=Kribbella aluminosa TaxID=416017 RepID=A0ABS4UJ84_9ACTN|nr:carbohydrate ABC transporter permease [Kribbella aluminosa]MBP2351674.1 ABC-type glycerol-3-phosphate transport system permease component [Kribbella aluminosa]